MRGLRSTLDELDKLKLYSIVLSNIRGIGGAFVGGKTRDEGAKATCISALALIVFPAQLARCISAQGSVMDGKTV